MLFAIRYPAVIGAAIAALFAAARWFLVPNDRKRSEWFLAASCLAIPASALCERVTKGLSHAVPLKFDQYMYRIDGLMGQPSFVLGRIAEHHLWLVVVGQIAYGLLPCAILAVWAAYLWMRPEAETLLVLRAFVFNLFLAVPIYILIPVCGPLYAFAGFPFSEPALTPHRIALLAPPNGIPSVHTSTALLILWFAWRWPLGRVLGVLYLALIVFSTLASGEHYLVDLIAAVPYAWAIYLLATRFTLSFLAGKNRQVEYSA